jgi:hypothetical protein
MEEFEIIHLIETDWIGICEEFNLKSGDVTPEQHAKHGHAIEMIKEVVIEFIKQNRNE